MWHLSWEFDQKSALADSERSQDRSTRETKHQYSKTHDLSNFAAPVSLTAVGFRLHFFISHVDIFGGFKRSSSLAVSDNQLPHPVEIAESCLIMLAVNVKRNSSMHYADYACKNVIGVLLSTAPNVETKWMWMLSSALIPTHSLRFFLVSSREAGRGRKCAMAWEPNRTRIENFIARIVPQIMPRLWSVSVNCVISMQPYDAPNSDGANHTTHCRIMYDVRKSGRTAKNCQLGESVSLLCGWCRCLLLVLSLSGWVPKYL